MSTPPQWSAPGAPPEGTSSGVPAVPLAPPGSQAPVGPPPGPPTGPVTAAYGSPYGSPYGGGQPVYAGGPPAPGYGAAIRPQPGIIPLRPLNLGDIYSGVMMAIRGNLAATLGLSLVVILVTTIPAGLFAFVVIRGRAFTGSAESIFVDTMVAVGVSMVPNLLQWVGSFLLSGFMAYVAGQGALGRTVSPSEVWQATKSRLGTMVIANLLLSVGVLLAIAVVIGIPVGVLIAAFANGTQDAAMGGMAFLVFLLFAAALIAVVFVVIRLTVLNPVIVLERSRAVASLRRTWSLTKGSWWRIFGITLVTGLIVGIASSILVLPLNMAMTSILGVAPTDIGGTLSASILSQTIGTVVIGTLLTPFSAGVQAVLYLDLRIRREGLDVQLMSAASGKPATR